MRPDSHEHEASIMSGRGRCTSRQVRTRRPRTARLLLVALILSVGGIWAPTNAAATESGAWHRTGSLSTRRAFFTATLLKSGNVLVVGGLQDPKQPAALDSAELYDPATGEWEDTGALETARYRHSATLLDSGKVLVVGGLNRRQDQPPTALASAELYDPSTGKWASTGSLEVPRVGHTATLLENGKVLVAGGIRGDPATVVYDPASGTWAGTGALPTARSGHTATLLKSGRVLVVGGEQDKVANDTGGIYASAAIYDPATTKWRMASSSGGRRSRHVATLLDSGKVLVAGGLSAGGGGPNSSVDLMGRTAAVELYDPAADSWAVTGMLPFAPVFQEAATVNSRSVLLVGLPFYRLGEAPQVSAHIYDTLAGMWKPVKTGAVKVRAFAPSLALLRNDDVLVIAGENRASYLYTVPGVDGESGLRLWIGVGVGSIMVLVFVIVRQRRRSRHRAPAVGGFTPR